MSTWNWQATDWRLIEVALEVAPNVLLYGPPGTGKSYCANSGRDDVYSLTMTEETPAAELRGHFIPKGDEGFVWHDGPAIRAWREGARLIVNEIDRASGDIMSLLYALADDPNVARLTLPTGETVQPQPGFQVIATTNAGPDALPEALQDRFPISFYVKDLAPGALESLAEDLRDACRNSVDAPGDRKASIRRWRAFDLLRTSEKFAQLAGERSANGVTAEEMAGRAVFGHRAEDVCDSLRLARAGTPLEETREEGEESSSRFFQEPDSDNEVCCYRCGRYTDASRASTDCVHCGTCLCPSCYDSYDSDSDDEEEEEE